MTNMTNMANMTNMITDFFLQIFHKGGGGAHSCKNAQKLSDALN